MKRFCTALVLLLAYSSQSQAQIMDWAAHFGGIGEDVTRGMTVDQNGNTYSTGYFTDQADYNPGEETLILEAQGFFDVFVQKLDTDGNLVWAKSFGGAFFDYGTGIASDALGNVYITGVYNETADFDPGEGVFELTSTGGEDIFIVKLDANGDFVFAKSVGSPDYEESTAIGVDELGNIYVSGYFREPGDYNPGEEEFILSSAGDQDAFILKLDNNGNFLWAHNIGGPEQQLSLGMRVSPSGDVYMAGPFSNTVDFDPSENTEEYSAGSSSHGFMLKLNSMGEFVHVATFGGFGNVVAWDVAIDAEGNAYAGGGFFGEITVLGNTYSAPDGEDAFVAKVDALGNLEWFAVMGGAGFQNCYGLGTLEPGYVVVSGYFNESPDFDPDTESSFNLTKASTEPFDAFYTILSADGSFVEAAQFGGSNFTEYHGVGADANGNIYLAAAFQNTVDLNPNPTEETEASVVDFRDNYVIKVLPQALGTHQKQLPEISLYPNPVSNFITISGITEQITYRIFSVEGKEIKSGMIRGDRRIGLSGITQGAYILDIDGYMPTKFVKH